MIDWHVGPGAVADVEAYTTIEDVLAFSVSSCGVNVLLRIRKEIEDVHTDEKIEYRVEDDDGIKRPTADTTKRGWRDLVGELFTMCSQVLGESIYSRLDS